MFKMREDFNFLSSLHLMRAVVPLRSSNAIESYKCPWNDHKYLSFIIILFFIFLIFFLPQTWPVDEFLVRALTLIHTLFFGVYVRSRTRVLYCAVNPLKSVWSQSLFMELKNP